MPQWWTASSRIVLALATAALAAAATPALGATPSAKGEPVRSSPCSWKPSKGTKSAPDAALKDQLGKKLHGSEALVELYAIDPTIKNATQRAVQRAVSDLQYEADLHKGEPGPPVFGFGQNWRLANNVALQVLPAHMKRAVKCVRENVSIAPGGELVLQQDPVAEWWPSVVGADALASVGPNVPVTIIDAGVDLTHPDFAGRAETAALNEQAVESGETHGTAAFSLIGAPANGVGTVGVYPQASVRLWDMPSMTVADAVIGIEAAIRAGPGVIYLGFATPVSDPILQDVVLAAVGEGSLVVAPAGNQGDTGNPVLLPGAFRHILTVAATDEANAPTPSSSHHSAVDLAAPGVNLPIAVPTAVDPSGYSVGEGTSFAAAIVAGAAAAVWSQRPEIDYMEIFDLMRFSAKDPEGDGFDDHTGFGVLDIQHALTKPEDELPLDYQEPNDDIYQVTRNGLFAQGSRPLTDPGRKKALISGELDATEDPEDVYRLWIPGRSEVDIVVKPLSWVGVDLWGPDTPSVLIQGKKRLRHLIDASYTKGTKPHRVGAVNTNPTGAWIYLDVFLPTQAADSLVGYTVEVKTLKPKT